MNKEPTIAVLIVAGGVGSRMGNDVPKQYMLVNGMPVIRHTIQAFKALPINLDIHCVIADGHQDFYKDAVGEILDNPPIIGGDDRQSSVFNGLKGLSTVMPEFVLIHDAARPCVSADDIHNVIHSLMHKGAVTLAMPINESIQRGDETINRENLWIVQTPQAFKFNDIWQCQQQAKKDGFIGTDDASIMRHYGHDVEIIPCGRHNLKITTRDDLSMASKLLHNKTETRVGNGFDVHAFSGHPSKSIRLCGVDIPFDKSLSGHSDADVGLHAITDAIFGALADGDIGSHFPPSDDSFKNMDSHVFLDKSVDNLKAKGGRIVHIDVTFMCEKPKIGLHRDAIRDHLSHHLGLSTGRISVKATTTEKLGFTGREEGIACQAVVTIEVPYED